MAGRSSFLEASAVVNRGEKVGLVGPKRRRQDHDLSPITREEEPETGRCRSIAHDGRLFLAGHRRDEGPDGFEATLDVRPGLRRGARAARTRARARRSRAREPDGSRWSIANGEAQAALRQNSAATASKRVRAKCLAGLGFEPAQMDGDVGRALGGWKMRVGSRASC